MVDHWLPLCHGGESSIAVRCRLRSIVQRNRRLVEQRAVLQLPVAWCSTVPVTAKVRALPMLRQSRAAQCAATHCKYHCATTAAGGYSPTSASGLSGVVCAALSCTVVARAVEEWP